MCDTGTACGPGPCGHGWMGHPGFQEWSTFMPYELQETDKEYIVIMPLPGYESKEITVSVNGSNILIEAEHPAKTEPVKEDPNAPTIVRSYARFVWDRPKIEVLVPVEEEIQTEKVKAKLNRGMLTATFEKKPRTKVPVEE